MWILLERQNYAVYYIAFAIECQRCTATIAHGDQRESDYTHNNTHKKQKKYAIAKV